MNKRSGVTVAVTVFVALAMGACAAPSEDNEDVASVSAAATGGGFTDERLRNAGWTCFNMPTPPPRIGCVAPGINYIPNPAIQPPPADRPQVVTVWAFDRFTHEFIGHVRLTRPEIYAGQPCEGDEPAPYRAPIGYHECRVSAGN